MLGQQLFDSVLSFYYNEYGTFVWENPAYQPPNAGENQPFIVNFIPSAETILNFQPIVPTSQYVNVTVLPQLLDAPTDVVLNHYGEITFTPGANNTAAEAIHYVILSVNGNPYLSGMLGFNINPMLIADAMFHTFAGNTLYRTNEWTVTIVALSNNPNFTGTPASYHPYYYSFFSGNYFAESQPSEVVYVHGVFVRVIGAEPGETIESIRGVSPAIDQVIRAVDGDTLTIAANPDVDRYVTWYGGGTPTGNSFTIEPLTGTMNITVTFFTGNHNTATFDLNGGTRISGGLLSQSVATGESATEPIGRNPGYIFDGWVSNVPAKTLDNITDDVTFTAQWVAAPVTVSTNYGWAVAHPSLTEALTWAGMTAGSHEILISQPQQLTSAIEISQADNVTLAGAGGVIPVTATAPETIFVLSSFELVQNIELIGNGSNTASLVWVNSGATFTMNETTSISGNFNTGEGGGGVTVSGIGAEFNMRGGEISGNYAVPTSPVAAGGAGGVSLSNGATMNMSGNARITGNINTAGGGGIRISDSTFRMDGGVIAGNSASEGGGIYMANSIVEISNGIITGNDALPGDGGANIITGIGAYGFAVLSLSPLSVGTFIDFPNGFIPAPNSLLSTNYTIEVVDGIVLRPPVFATFSFILPIDFYWEFELEYNYYEELEYEELDYEEEPDYEEEYENGLEDLHKIRKEEDDFTPRYDENEKEPDPDMETDYEPLTPEDVSELENDMKNLEDMVEGYGEGYTSIPNENNTETDYEPTPEEPEDIYVPTPDEDYEEPEMNHESLMPENIYEIENDMKNLEEMINDYTEGYGK